MAALCTYSADMAAKRSEVNWNACLVNKRNDRLVDAPDEHHLDDIHGGAVRDAEPAGKEGIGTTRLVAQAGAMTRCGVGYVPHLISLCVEEKGRLSSRGHTHS